MSVSRRTFTREFKLEVCRKVVQEQATKAATCREHSLSPSLLDTWLKHYEAKGSGAFSESAPVDQEKTVKELQASLGRAHLEIEFLREALGKLGIPAKRLP